MEYKMNIKLINNILLESGYNEVESKRIIDEAIENGEFAHMKRYLQLMNYATEMDGDQYREYSDISSNEAEGDMEAATMEHILSHLDSGYRKKLLDLLFGDTKCVDTI